MLLRTASSQVLTLSIKYKIPFRTTGFNLYGSKISAAGYSSLFFTFWISISPACSVCEGKLPRTQINSGMICTNYYF